MSRMAEEEEKQNEVLLRVILVLPRRNWEKDLSVIFFG